MKISDKNIYAFFGVMTLIVILLLPFKSKAPDGLERVAKDKGFANKEKGAQ